VWTWTAICADIKIVPSWLVGERTAEDAEVAATILPLFSSAPSQDELSVIGGIVSWWKTGQYRASFLKARVGSKIPILVRPLKHCRFLNVQVYLWGPCSVLTNLCGGKSG
jgi:hypothetical protein